MRVSVLLPAEYVRWAREEGKGNVSLGLRLLLEMLDQFQGAAGGPYEVDRQ